MIEAGHATCYPKALIVDNHMGCNASCTMCPLSGASRTRGSMSARLFDILLEQTAEIFDRIETIYLGLHGEPLRDRDLEDRIRRFGALGGKKCAIHTNASLLDPARAASLLEAGLNKFIISLESLDPAVYESIRRGLKHDAVLANILSLIALRDQRGFDAGIQIRFIVQAQNAKELPAYRDYWRDKLRPGLDELHETGRHNYLELTPGVSHYGNAPCELMMDSFVVLNDGHFPLCCLDYEKHHVFGHLERDSILEAYNSPRLRRLRDLHAAGRRSEIKPCDRCIYPEYVADTEVGRAYMTRMLENG